MTMVEDRPAETTTSPSLAAATARRARATPLLPVAATAAGLQLGSWLLVLAGITAGTALLLAVRLRVHAGLAVPAALLSLVAVAAVVGVASSLLGVQPLASQRWCAAACAATSVLAALGTRGAPDRTPWRVPRHHWLDRLGLLPAALAAAVAVLQGRDGGRAALPWSLATTDLAEHAIMLREVQVTGVLSYTETSYPRGLHALLALVTNAVGGPGTTSAEQSLQDDLAIWAAAVWLCTAVLLLAAWATARALLSRHQGGSSPAYAALVPWVLLGSLAWQGAFVQLGAAPSLLAVVSLWLLPVLCSARPDVGVHVVLLLGTAVTGLVAHLWQALSLVPATCTGVLLLVLLAPRGRRQRVQAAASNLLRHPLRLGAAALLLASAVPAVLGTLAAGGLSQAGIPGDMGAPSPLLASGAVSGLLLLSLDRSRGPVERCAWLGTAVGGLLVTTAMLVGSGDLRGLDQYYPRKALWFVLTAMTPLLALAAASAVPYLARIRERLPATPVLTAGAALCGVLAASAVLVLPGLVSPASMLRWAGSGSEPDGTGQRRLLLAQEYAERFAPAVTVPVELTLTRSDAQYGAYIVSKLLRFQTGQPANYGDLWSACADVRRVSRGGPAVVITDLRPGLVSRVLADQGCAHVPVVRPLGVDAELADEYVARVEEELVSAAAPS
jgi:hypothetical protein